MADAQNGRSTKTYKVNPISFPVSVMGRLTKTPELRHTGDGVPVTNITLAIKRSYAVGEGAAQEWKEETSFVNFSLWRQAAERIVARAKQGDVAMVQFNPTSLVARPYESNGEQRASIEANALNVKIIAWDANAAHDAQPEPAADLVEDEIPF